MEEAPELISPRISFSHDLANFTAPRSDASLLVSASSSSSRLPEPEFDFATANAAAADDVAPADRLFAGGKLLPMPPLPPVPRPTPCKHETSVIAGAGGRVTAPACSQKRPGSPASAFSRSSSVNSGTTTASGGAPRSAGRFGCPPFPLMRSWSASAAVARDGGGLGAAGDHRTTRCYKKFGGKVAASNGGGGGSSRAYYYGGSRKGGSGSSHGVRVSPVINVPFIGTSVVNVLSYLLCDCSTKPKKSREF